MCSSDLGLKKEKLSFGADGVGRVLEDLANLGADDGRTRLTKNRYRMPTGEERLVELCDLGALSGALVTFQRDE